MTIALGTVGTGAVRRFAQALRIRQTNIKVQLRLPTFKRHRFRIRLKECQMASPSEESSFAAMLAQSGMNVPPEQLPSLFEGYRHMIRLIALLGAPSVREAEPAVVFTTDQR